MTINFNEVSDTINASSGILNVTGLITSNSSNVITANTIPQYAITPSVFSITTGSTITPTTNNTQYNITSLSTAATIAAPTGSASDGQKLMIRIKDNGTTQNLTWSNTANAFRAVGVSFPSATTNNKVLYVGSIWNAQDSYWDMIAVAQQ